MDAEPELEEGGSDAAPATDGEGCYSGIKCKECGELSMRQDYIGTQECMVCVNCGYCDEVMFGDGGQEWCPSGTQYASGAGPSKHGKFHGPRDRYKEREIFFIGMLRDMAWRVKLPKHESTLMEEEARTLHRNGLVGSQMKKTAAALIFIALQRHSRTVSYKEVAMQLHIKVRSLGRTVMKLKKEPCISQASRFVTIEEKIEAVIDRLPSPPPMDVRIQAKKTAIDIKDLCSEKKIKGYFTECLSTDCAIFIIALEAVQKKKIKSHWIETFANSVKLAPTTLKTALWTVRAMLVSAAEEIPSIGPRVKSKAITFRNIQQFVPIILKNKVFLMGDSDDESSDEEPSGFEAGAGCGPVVTIMPPLASSLEDDSDAHLSDLDDDIKEYIATKKEVARKQRLQS